MPLSLQLLTLRATTAVHSAGHAGLLLGSCMFIERVIVAVVHQASAAKNATLAWPAERQAHVLTSQDWLLERKGEAHALKGGSVRAGLILLEVSVVVFLLQGYVTSGREVMLLRGCSCLLTYALHWWPCHSAVSNQTASVEHFQSEPACVQNLGLMRIAIVVSFAQCAPALPCASQGK